MANQTIGQSQAENFASFIWSVADSLRGPFQEDDYGNIILPFALLRRLECVLDPTRDQVYNLLKSVNFRLGLDDESMICSAAGAPFFNVTKFTLSTIGEKHTLQNIISYKNGFTPNVREILDRFEFDSICAKLDDKDKLFTTIHHFQKINLSPDRVPARAMSNLYEELIWRFATTKHKASKEFLTPRDVVRLATMLVLDSAGDSIFSTDKGLIRTIYDPTCGTCGFITDAMEVLAEHAASVGAQAPVTLIPLGQEVADQSWAMGKAMMLLSGSEKNPAQDNSDNIFLEDTLKIDKTGNQRFDFVLSNPPFGSDWGKDESVYSAVLNEHRCKGMRGRFGAGIPPRSDASMLFLQIVANKLNPKTVNEGGRGAIVLSGSPLFQSQGGSPAIRRWLLESDLVEAIIQLPAELFYNTGITTYLWILNTNKPTYRTNRIQLIDASSFKTSIKNLGNKRYEISPDQINDIVRIFSDFKESEVCKIVNYQEFSYRAVTIQRPLRKKLIISSEGIENLMMSKQVLKLSEDVQNSLKTALQNHLHEEHNYDWPSSFAAEQKKKGIKLGKPIQNAIKSFFGVIDPECDAIFDEKGNQLWDADLKQIEYIPFGESIDDYIKKEVLPFIPDAVVDTTVTDDQDGQIGIVGYEVNFNKYFYKFIPLEEPSEIKEVIKSELLTINDLMKEFLNV